MEQFTFYDLYFDVLSQLTDEEAGRFIKRICTYTVFEKDDTPSKSETENCFGKSFSHTYGRNGNRTARENPVLSQSSDAPLYL